MVPLTAEELAHDAAAAVAAGAGAVHVHPRGPDGFETLEPRYCDAAVSAIRRAVPRTPIGLTTITRAEPHPQRRVALVSAWTVPPDFVSLNLREDGTEELRAALEARGIAIEAGLWTLADAERFVAADWARRCARVLVEPLEQDPDAAVATARAIGRRVTDAGVRLPQLHHGRRDATWGVLRHAIAAGHDTRIGLEDALRLPDGAPARDNAQLVGLAVELAAAARG